MTPKKKMTALLFATALAGAGLAAYSVAADDGPMGHHRWGMGPGMEGMGPMGGEMRGVMQNLAMQRFDAIDANKDGTITTDEVKAYLAAQLKSLDANGDGKITAEEIAAYEMAQIKPMIEAQAAEMVKQRDLNGDGKLDVTELAAHPLMLPGARMGAMLERMVEMHGGALTKAQFADMVQQFGQMMGERHKGMGDHDGHGPGNGGWMQRWHMGQGQGPMGPGPMGPMGQDGAAPQGSGN